MPAKKGSSNDTSGTSNVRNEHPSVSPPLSESSDPIVQAVGIVDRKVRNLEKRKAKLESLQQLKNDGKELDRDQKDAVSKLGEVVLQLELAKELQKQYITFNESYQKTKKKQQKTEKQQQRESEREAQKSALAYSVRVQNLLAALDEVSKPDFRKGTNGAVLLTEEELTQLDDLYQLLVPTRICNADYQREVDSVGEHFLLLQEQSTKDVAGTTYKDLYNLIQKLDNCSYFDSSHNEEDLLSIEDDEYKSPEDGMADEEVAAVCYEPEEPTPQEPQPPPPPPTEPVVTQPPPFVVTQTAPLVPPPAVLVPAPAPQVLQPHAPSFAPSVPSPTFPALAVSAVGLPASEDMFSFMHKSEVCTQAVTFGDSQQAPSNKVTPDFTAHSSTTGVSSSSVSTAPQSKLPQQAQAPQDNTSGPSTTGTVPRDTEGKASTDASTGQLSPTMEGENPNAFQQQGGKYNRGGTSYRGQGSQFRRNGGGPRGGGGGGGYRNGSGRPYDNQGGYQQSYTNRGPSKGDGYQSKGDGYQSKGSGYQGGSSRGNGYQGQKEGQRDNGYYNSGRGNGRNYTEQRKQ